MPSAIKPCDCKHESQDKIYGKNMRVKNQTAVKGEKKTYRCTVCRKVD